MVAHCKPETSVTALLAAHHAAWDKCNAQWAAFGDGRADDDTIAALCDAQEKLENAKPATVGEWLAKWRQLAKYEAELGDPGCCGIADVMKQMMDEFEAITGAFAEAAE